MEQAATCYSHSNNRARHSCSIIQHVMEILKYESLFALKGGMRRRWRIRRRTGPVFFISFATPIAADLAHYTLHKLIVCATKVGNFG